MRKFDGADNFSANQRFAVGFAFFERVLSSAVPSGVAQSLFAALPNSTEERKESPAFPALSTALGIPPRLRSLLESAYATANYGKSPFLKEWVDNHTEATFVRPDSQSF